MMIISAIAAKSRNNVIGLGNEIPWHLPGDLKYFKSKTVHHHVLMGRKVFQSLGHSLVKRVNIVVTRNKKFLAPNCLVVHSIEEGIEIARQNGEEELFIIGGGEIYRQTLDRWDKLYLTEVGADFEGDVFFPEVDFNKWRLLDKEQHNPDDRNQFPFSIAEYDRKS